MSPSPKFGRIDDIIFLNGTAFLFYFIFNLGIIYIEHRSSFVVHSTESLGICIYPCGHHHH